jgi:hypothetical protein
VPDGIVGSLQHHEKHLVCHFRSQLSGRRSLCPPAVNSPSAGWNHSLPVSGD